MKLNVSELVTKLGFEDGNSAQKLKKYSDGVKKVAKGLAVVTGAASATTAGLFALATNVSKKADDIAKNSRALNIDGEAYQEYAYAADLAGISNDKFFAGLRKLGVNLKDAKDGLKTSTDLFDELGVTITDSNGNIKQQQQILDELTAAFAKMPRSTERSAIAMRLFGESGDRMADFLGQGNTAILEQRKELRELGNVITNETLGKSEGLNDNITRVKTAFAGLKTTIGSVLIPVFGDLAERFVAFAKQNNALLREKLADFFTKAGDAVMFFVEHFDKIVIAFKVLLALKVVALLLGIATAFTAISAPAIIVVGALAGITALLWAMKEPLKAVKGWFADTFKSAIDKISTLQEKLEKTMVGRLFKKGVSATPFAKLGYELAEAKSMASTVPYSGIGGKVLPDAFGYNKGANLKNPSQNINIQENVTVNVPQGTPQEQMRSISETVTKEMQQQFQKIFRETSNNLAVAQ